MIQIRTEVEKFVASEDIPPLKNSQEFVGNFLGNIANKIGWITPSRSGVVKTPLKIPVSAS